MARHCYVPEELKSGPFSLRQARALGLTRTQLRGSAWRRVAHGWYRWAGSSEIEMLRLAAIAPSLPPGAAFAGLAAARVFGLDLPMRGRPEVVVPQQATIATRVEANVRRIRLDPADVTVREGLPVTSPLRTCFDLAGRLPLVDAVAAVDMALHAGLLELEEWRGYVLRQATMQGVVRARRVLGLVEPKAESPMETRLRMLLVLGGLPRPQAQVSLYDARGDFVGRPDLYYPEARLGVEYDGENHRDRLTSDNRRQNRLQEIGVALLRYSAPDLIERPAGILAEVRAALRREEPFLGKGASKRAA